MNTIQAWLKKSMGNPKRSAAERFVALHGQIFTIAGTSLDILRGSPKECFMNAALLALEDSQFTYAEGYACNYKQGGAPFLHGWVVQDSHAADPTLKYPDEYEYFGILVRKPLLIEMLAEQKHYGLLNGALSQKFLRRWQDAYGNG